MDQNYAQKHGFNLTKLEYPITARNVDGTENKQGTIQYYTDLDLCYNFSLYFTFTFTFQLLLM
jgi:hypothetical protein